MRKKYISDFSFSFILINWYEENKRNLPWRLTNNPYLIWLSEVILQQTRVDQGLPYYNSFVENYPQIELLANAPEDEVLKLWQGLGYYSRARNLHHTAKYIAGECGGIFPNTYKEVLALKGVGEYTAAAILSFAYNKPYAAVDGNVYRVLSRIFGVEDYIDTSTGKKAFQDLATELMDMKRAGLYNQAIMEFGSMQCTPSSPNCSICPFAEKCVAYNEDAISTLPKKKGKTATRNRYFNYFDVYYNNNRFLKKREGQDIWQGLYEFPLIETDKEIPFEELCNTAEYKKMFPDSSALEVRDKKTFKHILSHQVIFATFYTIYTDRITLPDYRQIETDTISEYAVSRLTHKYLENL